MERDEAVGGSRPPAYEGEDVSPTTKRELRGWYTYAVAAEAFAVCGVGSFLPLTLEQLAREGGVLLSDPSTPCVSYAGSDSTGASNSRALHLFSRAPTDNGQCIVHLFGAQVNTASFAMYTFSLAVFFQALILVSFSSMADHGNNRKSLLLGFGFVGATATMLFILVVHQIYLVASLLVVIGVVCLGSSFVMLNSFLPLLVANHPSMLGKTSQDVQEPTIALNTFASNGDSARSNPSENENYNVKDTSSHDTISELQLSAKISSQGTGIGYGSAVFVQLLCILSLFLLSKTSISSKSLPLRIVLFLVGLWWFGFTLLSSFWLRNRPGPPLNPYVSRHGRSVRSLLAYIVFGWSSLWKTVKTATKLRQLVIFLVAWFLLSDGIATISGTAILFAKTELHMETVAVACLSVLATTSALAGAFAWPIISRRLKLKINHTIIVCVCMFEIIPLYGLMGYLPFVKNWGVGGLQQQWEIFPLGFVHGFVMGGLSSYCRSFYGLLIPPGSEASFYALYAITDKGSSVFGPAIVGAIVDSTGDIRPAFWFLAVLLVLPIPLILWVDVEKGRKDGIAMAEQMKGSKIEEEDLSSLVEGRGEEREGLLAEDE